MGYAVLAVQIEFIAHATFFVHLNDGRRIVIDPYKAYDFGGRFNYPPFETQCDLVCITHDHNDHSYTGDLRGDFVVVRDRYESRGLCIESVRAAHDAFGGTRHGGFVDMKIIQADGLRLCHAGDLGEILNAAQIKALGAIDILILPVGGHYTIDAEQALQNAALLAPKMLIPCHYQSALCTLPLAALDEFLGRIADYKTAKSWNQSTDDFEKYLILQPRFGFAPNTFAAKSR